MERLVASGGAEPQKELTNHFRSYFDPFWVRGLAVLCVLLGGVLRGARLVVYLSSLKVSVEHL